MKLKLKFFAYIALMPVIAGVLITFFIPLKQVSKKTETENYYEEMLRERENEKAGKSEQTEMIRQGSDDEVNPSLLKF